MKPTTVPPILFALALAAGCGSTSKSSDGADGGSAQCDPAGDDDRDCLSNELEGCPDFRDTDQDGEPDWADIDADGDGVFDSVEADGQCDDPPDNDSDGTPDYVDTDSDNDGLVDGLEDRDGDGKVGTCTQTCSSATDCDSEAGETCSLPASGGDGVCVSLQCLDGETDPNNADTDGDGVVDLDEGTFICNPFGPNNPEGLKPIYYVDSADTVYAGSNWRVGLNPFTQAFPAMIAQGGPLEAAYLFDLPDSQTEVAGFLVSRPSQFLTATDEANAAAAAIEATPGVTNVVIRVSGSNIQSLDGFETVVSTVIEVSTAELSDATAMRKLLLSRLLGRNSAQVTLPDTGWQTAPETDFVVVLQSLFRPEQNQTLYMGAVASLASYDNRARLTAIDADDMANGTGLTVSGNGERDRCQQYLADQQALADIIWIVDESGSTLSDRDEIAANATTFFEKALDIGLDFRMAVTDMNDTSNGVFATRDEDGSNERWIMPNEAAEFALAIEDPSGPASSDGGSEHGLTQAINALTNHGPPSTEDPLMFRPDAQIAVIIVTDEKPDEVEDAGIMTEGDHEPTLEQAAQLAEFMAPYITLFQNTGAIAHLIAEPLPYGTTCSSGGAEHAAGYYELVNALGGQIGSICQPDLGPTLDAMIDSIVADASPINLAYVPISTSISVVRDGEVVPRSRQHGWDYRAASNSIIFYDMPIDPANPSEIVVAYRRWAEQVAVD